MTIYETDRKTIIDLQYFVGIFENNELGFPYYVLCIKDGVNVNMKISDNDRKNIKNYFLKR